MKFYKDHYQVIIIGGALAGMSAALQLQAKGVKDILILEKHNLPGGLATDFVRNGIEIEATLHEMMSIGKRAIVSRSASSLTIWALTSTGFPCPSATASSCRTPAWT